MASASPPCISGLASLRRRNEPSTADRLKDRLKSFEAQDIEGLIPWVRRMTECYSLLRCPVSADGRLAAIRSSKAIARWFIASFHWLIWGPLLPATDLFDAKLHWPVWVRMSRTSLCFRSVQTRSPFAPRQRDFRCTRATLSRLTLLGRYVVQCLVKPSSKANRKVSSPASPRRLQAALWELENIYCVRYLLGYVDSLPLGRNVRRPMNRGESVHRLLPAVGYANRVRLWIRRDLEPQV